MARLFVDLDGVIADFNAGALAALGMSAKEFQELHGVALLWKRLAEVDGFYDGLPWMADGHELWDALKDYTPPPMILTGLPLGDWAAPQKRDWCARELGEGFVVVTCMSVDKHGYCCEGDVLIDDRESARLDWETAGGVFVLHTSTAETLAALRELGIIAAEGTFP